MSSFPLNESELNDLLDRLILQARAGRSQEARYRILEAYFDRPPSHTPPPPAGLPDGVTVTKNGKYLRYGRFISLENIKEGE